MALWIYKGEYKKFAVILPSLGRAIAAEWGVPKEFPSDEQTEKDLLRLGFKRFESEPEKPKYHKKKKENHHSYFLWFFSE